MNDLIDFQNVASEDLDHCSSDPLFLILLAALLKNLLKLSPLRVLSQTNPDLVISILVFPSQVFESSSNRMIFQFLFFIFWHAVGFVHGLKSCYVDFPYPFQPVSLQFHTLYSQFPFTPRIPQWNATSQTLNFFGPKQFFHECIFFF